MKYLAGDIAQISEINNTGYNANVANLIVEISGQCFHFDNSESPMCIYRCFVVSESLTYRWPKIDVFNKDLIPVLLVPK